MRRLRALVFAYACDPHAGSEPAAGWAVVRAIARFADAVVLVGPEHERALVEWKASHASDPMTFVVVSEPWWARFIPRTRTGHFIIFLGWLAKARIVALGLDPRRFDLAWHATYSAYWLPTPASELGLPCVWGPVGGGVTTPAVWWSALGPAGKLGDAWERATVRAMAFLPQTRRTWRHVSAALVQNDETRARLPAFLRDRAVVLNHALLTQPPEHIEQPRGRLVVFAGSLEARKAPSLVIRALAHADPAVRVLMIGDGPERLSLRRLADQLGVRDRVTFAGRLPRAEVMRAWRTAAAGIFTGLHEEGGIALAEAMLAGTPVIVLAHGGARAVAESATDRSRVSVIPPGERDETARKLGEAMTRCVREPSTRTDALLDGEHAVRQLEALARRVVGVRTQHVPDGTVRPVDRVAETPAVTRWITRGSWAVADQALFACSNFVITILLARWLPALEYGAFVTSYAVFLIASMLHAGVITDPLVVFGSDRYTPWFSAYLRRLIWEHFLLTGLASLAIAAAAAVIWWLQYPVMAVALVGMACAGPFILLAQVTRRACYARFRPTWAALSGLVNLLLVVAGLLLLYVSGRVSIVNAQVVMAAAALSSALSVLPVLMRQGERPATPAELAAVRREHIAFGRWTAASGILTWTTTQGSYVWLALWGGLAETAAFRAMLNLVLPILHMDLAFAGLLVPALVRRRADPRSFRRIVQLAVAGFATEAALYGVGLVLFGSWIMHVVYGGTYSADPRVLMLVALIPPASSLLNTFAAALKALEQPHRIFQGTLAGAVVMVTLGIVAARQWGSVGVIAAMLTAMATQIAIVVFSLVRHSPRAQSVSSVGSVTTLPVPARAIEAPTS